MEKLECEANEELSKAINFILSFFGINGSFCGDINKEIKDKINVLSSDKNAQVGSDMLLLFHLLFEVKTFSFVKDKSEINQILKFRQFFYFSLAETLKNLKNFDELDVPTLSPFLMKVFWKMKEDDNSIFCYLLDCFPSNEKKYGDMSMLIQIKTIFICLQSIQSFSIQYYFYHELVPSNLISSITYLNSSFEAETLNEIVRELRQLSNSISEAIGTNQVLLYLIDSFKWKFISAVEKPNLKNIEVVSLLNYIHVINYFVRQSEKDKHIESNELENQKSDTQEERKDKDPLTENEIKYEENKIQMSIEKNKDEQINGGNQNLKDKIQLLENEITRLTKESNELKKDMKTLSNNLQKLEDKYKTIIDYCQTLKTYEKNYYSYSKEVMNLNEKIMYLQQELQLIKKRDLMKMIIKICRIICKKKTKIYYDSNTYKIYEDFLINKKDIYNKKIHEDNTTNDGKTAFLELMKSLSATDKSNTSLQDMISSIKYAFDYINDYSIFTIEFGDEQAKEKINEIINNATKDNIYNEDRQNAILNNEDINK